MLVFKVICSKNLQVFKKTNFVWEEKTIDQGSLYTVHNELD